MSGCLPNKNNIGTTPDDCICLRRNQDIRIGRPRGECLLGKNNMRSQQCIDLRRNLNNKKQIPSRYMVGSYTHIPSHQTKAYI